MIHIRIDDEIENSKRKFACGIGPALPEGDTYFYVSESIADVKADCPGCNPNPRQIGTPCSAISGRPGHSGFSEFTRIAETWGYD